MVIQNHKILILSSGMMLGFTTMLGMVLASSRVSADDTSVVDEINITVPVSCSMSGTGMNSHNTEIANGIYTADIGTTTLHAFCNDNEGFAIYAAGYTGNEVGGTNSNKLVGTTASGNATIESGIATTAGNPDVSNWAMKLTMTQDSGDTSTDNAFTIDSAPNEALPSQAEPGVTQAPFSAYHVVPNEYTKVAHKNSMTDMTETTGGVKLTTTYAAYISKTQPADTYSGQVIYTLVHPSSHAAPGAGVSVTYNSGELQFAGGGKTNVVTYETTSTQMYIASTPVIAETSNLINGEQTGGAYTDSENVLLNQTFTGASKVKVIVDYGFTGNTAELLVIDDTWDGDWDNWNSDWDDDWLYSDVNISGTKEYTLEGDTVMVFGDSWGTPVSGYDYGFSARVYPIYATEQSGTNPINLYDITDSTGTYIEPNHFKGFWTIGNETFVDEVEIKAYISEHAEEVASTGLTVTAANPYAIVYDGNTASAGTMNGFVTIPDPANPYDASGINNMVDLMAPNYMKAGYGFAGWSENPNASVDDKIPPYGPNESIPAYALSYDEDNNKSAVLYAVWVQSSGNMQSFSCSDSGLGTNQVTALTDTRDNSVYTVGKLADGNCWMMENLRLDNTATISSINTDNPATGFTSIAASTDDWCEDDNETCINQNKLNTNNTNNINLNGTNASGTPLINGPGQYNGSNTNGDTKGSDGNNFSWYSYGNYYNWYTATAGTGTYAQTSDNAAGSICPSGWTLPSGGSGGQYSSIDFVMGGTGSYQSTAEASNRWRTYPANFLYSGGWQGFVAGTRGFSGVYWSRTAGDNINARFLYFNAEGVSPGTGGGDKRDGLPVRCLSLGSQSF